MLLDAHHHIWDPALHDHAWLAHFPSLRRRFDLGDFRESARPAGVTSSVLVQALNDRTESIWLLEEARRDPSVKGVVVWVDLQSDTVQDQLAELGDSPGGEKIVGVRHLVHDEPDPDYLRRPAVVSALRILARAGLRFDLLVRPRELPAAIECAEAVGDLQFVVDHIAKPEMADGIVEPWRTLIGQIAKLPNVSCKLSGLVTEGGVEWHHAPIARYVSDVIDAFGVERLMFGSDWPVCLEVATYTEVLDHLQEIVIALGLSPDERAKVFHDNGSLFYQLSEEHRVRAR
jgi:L-fuconolactonase